MSPEFVREVIANFSSPGDTILDPFTGGGTTLVEALAQGRRSIGVDLNPLATFVATVKTTPLSSRDAETITRWIADAPFGVAIQEPTAFDSRAKNFPPSLVNTFDSLLRYTDELPYPRQRRFVRCALLRLGQWAVDCKCEVPSDPQMRRELLEIILEMLVGLDSLVEAAAAHGVQKHRMTGCRTILLRSSIGLEESLALEPKKSPRLVITSPPYPAVHVVYNRWQVFGRRETPAPYWLIGAPDGHGASFFTLGSRTAMGVDRYFQSLTEVFRSVRAVVAPDALVVQLVSFSDAETQLPAYTKAMNEAGFEEATIISTSNTARWRTVPNRKWYTRIDETRGSARELLLFHQPADASGAASLGVSDRFKRRLRTG